MQARKEPEVALYVSASYCSPSQLISTGRKAMIDRPSFTPYHTITVRVILYVW